MTPQMIPQDAPVPPPIPKGMSEPARLAGVFFSPGKTFPDIARRPRWWIPLILIALVGSIVANTYGRRVGWETLVRQQIENSSRADQMTPQQKQQAIQVGSRIAGIVGYASPVIVALVVLVIAAVLIFVYNTLMGAQLEFPSMMGIVSYAYLPSVVSGLLTLFVMFMKDPDDFDLQRPLAFNVGAFLPDGLPRWAVQLGTSIDLFNFWIMALIAIGVSSTVRKIKFGRAFMGVFAPWVIVILLRTFAMIAFG